ncbi:MAG: hypothetical protein ACRC0L_03180 [Angustibacter sp.]
MRQLVEEQGSFFRGGKTRGGKEKVRHLRLAQKLFYEAGLTDASPPADQQSTAGVLIPGLRLAQKAT